jgi:hypothetical protein
MKAVITSVLCVLLIFPSHLMAVTWLDDADALRDLVAKSYLDLLELREIPRFSSAEIRSVEIELNRSKDDERNRLKKEQERIEQELKTARKRLEEMNKTSSSDDAKTAGERTNIHCDVLRLESDLAKTKTERDKGVPIIYQNKFAKLELIRTWPAIRTEIEQNIEAGRARARRYGDIDDIGIRDLGIDNLAEKQHQDIRTGQDAIRELKTQGLLPPEVEDKDLLKYVERLAAKIAANSDLKIPIKVSLLDSMEINAFALPGGFLFVNSGLINKAESESELAGVLAHEIAHAAARHGARLMKRATIADILFQAAQVGAILFTGGIGLGAYYALQYGFYGLGMILDLTLLGVSRDYEAEADQLGAQYAWRAGFDPRGFITFFDNMAKEEGYVKSTSFFRTHPPFLDRIVSTFSEITYLPQTDTLQVDSSEFTQARKRAAELIRQREQEEKNKPSLREKAPDCSQVQGTSTN